MLMKLIALAAVFFLIYIMFFKKSVQSTKTEHEKSMKKEPKSETMMECKECGTFVSEDDTIIKDGLFYCSKSCAGVK